MIAGICYFTLLPCFILILAIITIKKEKEYEKLEAEKKRELEKLKVERIERKREYEKLEAEILKTLGFSSWNIIPYFDEYVTVKSRQSLEKYDDVKFFKENKEKLTKAEDIINKKNEIANILIIFLEKNEYKNHKYYYMIVKTINNALRNTKAYRICVQYISSAGNLLDEKEISLNRYKINRFKEDASLLMSKGEYNKYLKEQQKEALNKKHHEYYERVNSVIDYANENRNKLIVKGSQEQLDNLIGNLFDRTVNNIKKIKTINSEEWNIIEDFIVYIEGEIKKIVTKNQKIIEYYNSSDFLKIKEMCETLMSSQREFNEYINEKIQSISKLFGAKIVRNKTINNDEYNYIRPYKKTINPFTAEVSSTVFASAENNPLEYIVKNFYPDKSMYPEQIKKLYLFIEEIETLKEAKQIIENYKKDYQQYLKNVPSYIIEEDEKGFYSRLGFTNIDEDVLIIEYKFSYTSNGGMAQRSFTVPMTEETIIKLINILENKLTTDSFVKEQRTLMTKKMREFIKNRDNFTCCNCGNSIYKEPNLLLEIDHIIPVAEGGYTKEENLQTLCWKCNRKKAKKYGIKKFIIY